MQSNLRIIGSDLMEIPWKTLCGTAITITALLLGYDGYLAVIAVGALFGVEIYGQRKKLDPDR